MREWTLRLRGSEQGMGYCERTFDGPSMEGPGPIVVVEKAAYEKAVMAVRLLYSADWNGVDGHDPDTCPSPSCVLAREVLKEADSIIKDVKND